MFSIFTEEPRAYDKHKAKAYILKIRNAKDDVKMNRFRMELFKMMSKIVVKNINNYLKLCNNSPLKDHANNAGEMQSEAFIIFDNCIKNFDLKLYDDFYFYYNKSLNRVFFRMFSDDIRKGKRGELIMEYITIFSSSDAKNYADEDVEFLVSQLGLTDDEGKVLLSKVIHQNKQDFIKMNKSFDSKKYQACIERIKIVLTKYKYHGFNL